MGRQGTRIGYSLNVFPDESLEELRHTLRHRAPHIRREAYHDREFPVELRFSQRMVEQLHAQPAAVAELRDLLRDEGLRLVALNAFVPISFHQPNLKERVYLPTWHESDQRLRYTCDCADLLAALAPPEVKEPTLSVPAGALKRDFSEPVAERASVQPATPERWRVQLHEQTATALRRCAQHCAELERRTGRRVTVGLEPEPGLAYERTSDVIKFFTKFRPALDGETGGGRYLGVNFDICHQLVEFEDLAQSVAALQAANIQIAKIHISNCIEIEKPLIAPELLEALRRRYAESKFLHQTCGVNAAGRPVYFSLDLPPVLTPDGLRAMAHAGVEKLRIHYHMPLLPGGAMPTTLADVETFVRGFAKATPKVPLVIETYTWLELTAGGGTPDLVPSISDEIRHVSGWL
ncbi:MAG: metabolite traffic protein EboE [Verrucomicrobia bacterium]|nr:metabolite traffic protein EboE [Verrucomicrobiota bacterium]